MPFKLIGFIFTLFLIITFIGVNLGNSSDIRIWFGDKGLLKDVPIFVSFFVMYVIGVLSVVPFLVSWGMKRKSAARKKDSDSDKAEEKEKKNVRVLGSKKQKKKNQEMDSQDIDPDTKEKDDDTEEEESS